MLPELDIVDNRKSSKEPLDGKKLEPEMGRHKEERSSSFLVGRRGRERGRAGKDGGTTLSIKIPRRCSGSRRLSGGEFG